MSILHLGRTVFGSLDDDSGRVSVDKFSVLRESFGAFVERMSFFSSRFLWTMTMVLILFCFYANQVWAMPGNLVVKVLDIGQGDSIFIQTPLGKHLLVDGGPGVKVLERLEEEMGFFDRHFDLVVMSHPDLDHIEGLVEVFKRYRVDRVLMTGVVHQTSLYVEVLRMIEDRGVDVLFAHADEDYLIEDHVTLDVLYPERMLAGQLTSDSNNTSVVTKLVYGNTSYLFSADCEVECETIQLATNEDLDADIVTGGHHGSRTAFSLPYLRTVSPKLAAVSNGRSNRFGHPHAETIQKFNDLGVPFLNTKDVGTIEVRSDGNEWVW